MRLVWHLLGIICCTGLFGALILFPERILLQALVVPLSDTPLSLWIDDFMIAAFNYGLWMTFGVIVIWYFIARFFFKVVQWEKAKKRAVWVVFGVVGVIVCFGVGFVYTERTQAGGNWAWVFYLLNSALLYYLATALFSPDSFKYTPIGAKHLRRWW